MAHCAACGESHPDDVTSCPRTGEPVGSGPCGKRIDRYEIEKLLGGGGMGNVYRAKHVMLGQPVAFKLLHRSIASRADMLERFLREARAAASAGSAHIIRMFDCGITPENTAFIAMELLQGSNLQALIEREKRLTPARAVDLTLQVLDGLGVAHAAGVVHRDMKPANVYVTPLDGGREHATVLDFGISKVVDDGSRPLTQTGMVIGTPVYMAPEQFVSAKDIDLRADLYATGVMLYEMLAGRLPFDGANTAEVMVKACTGDITPLSAVAVGVPAPLIAVVDRALAREKTARYQSAKEFSDALRAAMQPVAQPPTRVEFAPTMMTPEVSVPRTVAGAPAAPVAPWGVAAQSGPQAPMWGGAPMVAQPAMAQTTQRSRWGWIVAAVLAAVMLFACACIGGLYYYGVDLENERDRNEHDNTDNNSTNGNSITPQPAPSE